MASAESDSEEEFSEEESDSDDFDSDVSEVSDCFLEDMSSLLDQHEEPNDVKSCGNFSEVVNTEDGSSAICKENSKMPNDNCRSLDPGEKKLPVVLFFFIIYIKYIVILQLTFWLCLYILEQRKSRIFLDKLSVHVFTSLLKAK